MDNPNILIFSSMGLLVSIYIYYRYIKIKGGKEKVYKFYAPVYLMVALLGICVTIVTVLIAFGLVK